MARGRLGPVYGLMPRQVVWCHLFCCSTSSTPCPSWSLQCWLPWATWWLTIWFFVLRICAYWTPSGIGGFGAGHTEHSHECCTLITSIDMWLPSPWCFSHTYCLHQDTIHLACSDPCFSRLYELYIIMLAMDSEDLFILLSDAVILRTALAIASAGKRLKKYTYISHTPAVFTFLLWACPLCTESDNTPHPGAHPYGQSVCAFPPLMNPVNFSIEMR